jgi:murein DD-endopeptidase MepM/ murein hydrolase activator NlpD
MEILHKELKASLRCLLFVCTIVSASASTAEGKEITNDVCKDRTQEDIPVGDFENIGMPQSSLYINQGYDTTSDEGFWSDKGNWLYGHDGLDTEGESETPGVNDVAAMLDGVVILSRCYYQTDGWGESIIIATRANEYSGQVITHHYHHMHAANEGESYWTTRKFNACDYVTAGEVIGKEGNTGNSGGSHLHVSIRLWQNVKELNEAIAAVADSSRPKYPLFGYGYTSGDDEKLARNLDPQGFIFNTFSDYQWEEGAQPPYGWSLSSVLTMRAKGVDFGFFDGRFGAGEQVKKRGLARWLKIAARRQDSVPQTATFSDLPLDDPDSVYVEMMVRYPQGHPVFNPDHSCQGGAKKFCPDAAVNRAEALKAVIMAFYGDEFIRDYDQNIWAQSYNLAIQLLDIFTDVPVLAWYAPYVYFGVNHGLVSEQDLFSPQEPVSREQMAKWIVTGIGYVETIASSLCYVNACPEGYYCETMEGGCVQVPICVPYEANACEIGGGYVPEPPPSPACATGYTQCQSDCCDNKSETCFEGSACYCVGNFLDCGNGICKNSQTDNNNCGGCGNVCDSGESCTNGFCVPGQTCQCSSGTCCDGCHIKPDIFTASPAKACFNNTQGAGTPTLCLEMQKVNGPNFRYRACKQTGIFQNPFTYQLKDNNNLVNFNKYNGSQGATCTGWQNFEVSYIGYGSGNGAGLQAEIISPPGCVQTNCKYKTGTITISKTCN